MNSEKFWDKLAKNYDSQVGKYQEAYNNTINRTKPYLNKNSVVMELACGTGITTCELSKVVQKIHAIDISQKMIEASRQKAKDKGIENIEFEKTDLLNAGFQKEFFAVAIAFNVLVFIQDLDKTLDKFHEILKPGGVFISVTDCFREKIKFSYKIIPFLSRFGLVPRMHKYSIAGLENIIKSHNFEIIETDNFFQPLPNYFIVAKKI